MNAVTDDERLAKTRPFEEAYSHVPSRQAPAMFPNFHSSAQEIDFPQADEGYLDLNSNLPMQHPWASGLEHGFETPATNLWSMTANDFDLQPPQSMHSSSSHPQGSNGMVPLVATEPFPLPSHARVSESLSTAPILGRPDSTRDSVPFRCTTCGKEFRGAEKLR